MTGVGAWIWGLLVALHLVAPLEMATMAPSEALPHRAGWQPRARAPEAIDGAIPAPQGVAFLDASTALLAVHQQDRVSVLYRLDVTMGQFTGRAVSRDYQHFNSIKVRANGEVWAAAFVPRTGGQRMVQIDVARSFASGEVVVRREWDMGDNAVDLAFIWVGGKEYVLAGHYLRSGQAWLYVFSAQQLGSDVTPADRVKRLDIGLQVQDIALRPEDGLLYASRNAAHGAPMNAVVGWIQSYDIAAAIQHAPDGAVLEPIATRLHASPLTEGLAFHPTTGALWTATEGRMNRGDSWEYAGLWSAELDR